MDAQSFISANAATAAFLATAYQATYQRIAGQPGITALRHRVQSILDTISMVPLDHINETTEVLLINAPQLLPTALAVEAFDYLNRMFEAAAFDFITLAAESDGVVVTFTVTASSAPFEIPPFVIPCAALQTATFATVQHTSVLFHQEGANLCPHAPWSGLPVVPPINPAVEHVAANMPPPPPLEAAAAVAAVLPPPPPQAVATAALAPPATITAPVRAVAPPLHAEPPRGPTWEEYARFLQETQKLPTEQPVQISEATQAKYRDTRRTRAFFQNVGKYTDMYSASPTPTLEAATTTFHNQLRPFYNDSPNRAPSKEQLHVVMTLTFTVDSLSCCSGGHGKPVASHQELIIALAAIARAVRVFFGDTNKHCDLADAIAALQIDLIELLLEYHMIPVSAFAQRAVDAFQQLLSRENDVNFPVDSPLVDYLQAYFHVPSNDAMFLRSVRSYERNTLLSLTQAAAAAATSAPRPKDAAAAAKTSARISATDPNSVWENSVAKPPKIPALHQPLPAGPSGASTKRFTVPCYSWVNGTCSNPQCPRPHGYHAEEPAANVATFAAWVKANKTLRK